MSYWNQRVVLKKLEDGTDWYSIREVYYNDDGTIYAWTEDAMEISSESLDGLKRYVQQVLACLDKPVLIDGEVKFVSYDSDKDNLPLDNIDDL